MLQHFLIFPSAPLPCQGHITESFRGPTHFRMFRQLRPLYVGDSRAFSIFSDRFVLFEKVLRKNVYAWPASHFMLLVITSIHPMAPGNIRPFMHIIPHKVRIAYSISLKIGHSML
jgi:hypothetical protein